MTLVTQQTGPEGKLVRKVYVEAGSDIARELYLAIILDRGAERFAIIASTEGGMDIEEVAEKTPEKILTELIDPLAGLQAYQIRKVARARSWTRRRSRSSRPSSTALFELFVEKDASPGRDQPARRDRGRRSARPRRQAQLRRQRALPAPGDRRAARPRRGGSARARGQRDRPRLRRPRRQHRLHGQRRRPRDGDPRHDHRGRRQAGQLPRRRRRRRQGEGRRKPSS